MGKVYKSIDKLIGNTPLVELSNVEKDYALQAKLLAKVEYFNPAGSIKDRVAKQMIEDAIKQKKLFPNSVIIEPTSGNTGIGLSLMGAIYGYRVIIVMPDNMSVERIKIMRSYGAEVVLTDGKLGMKGAIDKANELAREIDNSIIFGQFSNPSNPKAHYLTTAPEIYQDTNGKVDIVVAGIGTGGTISGVGRYLKEKNPLIKIIGVEPEESAFLTTGKKGAHVIQGIGAGFLPDNLDKSVVDVIETVKGADALETAKMIAKKEGIFVGISAGGAVAVALKYAQKEENKNKTIVVILPDGGERYLS